jgi:serine/threonine-protein kinase
MTPLPITPATWPLVSALLDEALSLPLAERAAFIEALSGERAALRDTLRALLAQPAAIETDAFLPQLTGAFDAQARELEDASQADRAGLTELAAGVAIGPYRLLRPLGEGGMGSVWLAERADGSLKRQVALKLPRLAWGRGLAERMAREREILASLEHPHIARLYDAGVDQHGRPYLALEYVEGLPIDAEATRRSLPVPQRLGLLQQVCAAVAFAHSRLIVHRDLKPSNILVTGDGQVRLLDFGIAKLLEGDRAQETQLTQMAGRALTLDYASPEQIKGEPIGTASDVYSLGVVAYELLTGRKPYKLKRGSAAELEEAIAQADVARASEATTDPALRRALRGDLDAILNKALKKDPAQRYPTVDAFAQDITRHLNSEPVSAQPDAFAYRAGKFLRRYRLQAAAGGVVMLSLGAGLTVALWQAQETQRQRDRAVAAAQEADRNAARAAAEADRARQQEQVADAERTQARQAAQAARTETQRAEDAARQAARAANAERLAAQLAREQSARAAAVQRYLVGIFSQSSVRQADPKKAQAVTARELLDLGAQRLDTDLAEHPAARHEMAATLSELYSGLGLGERAVPLAKTAFRLAEELHGRASPQAMAAMARLFTELQQSGKQMELEQIARDAEQILQRPSRPSPERLRLMRSLATYAADRDRADAVDWSELALLEARKIGDPIRIAEAEGVVGRIAERRSEWAKAEKHLAQAVAQAENVRGVVGFDLTIVRALLVNAQANQLRIPEAESTLRKLIEDVDARLGADHLDAQQLRYRLGSMLVYAGRAEDALAPLREAIDSARRAGADRELLSGLALLDLGLALRDLGDADGAERAMREALTIRDRLRPNSIPAAAQREDLAELLMHRDQAAAAWSLMQEAERIRATLGKAGWDRHQARRANLLRVEGRLEEAHAVLSQVATGADGAPLSSLASLTIALSRSALDLDRGELNEASERLKRIGRALADLNAIERAPQPARMYRLACGRLDRARGDPVAAERHFNAVEHSLGSAYGASSPVRVMLQRARLQPVMAASGADSC